MKFQLLMNYLAALQTKVDNLNATLVAGRSVLISGPVGSSKFHNAAQAVHAANKNQAQLNSHEPARFNELLRKVPVGSLVVIHDPYDFPNNVQYMGRCLVDAGNQVVVVLDSESPALNEPAFVDRFIHFKF